HFAYTTLRPDVFQMVPETAMDILDVGCSNGELGASLRSAVPGRRVVGIDLDRDFCEQAKTRLDEFIHADLNHLDWEKTLSRDRFDCLIFADVLEHLADPWGHLASACTCLRPGGTVVVSLPNIRHISALYSIFVRGTFPRNARGLFDQTHFRWFTVKDATDLLTSAGLIVEKYDFNLRVGDRGGGLLNRIAGKVLGPVKNFSPVREFLAYQVCLLGRKPDAARQHV
ncbi:MAG: class I SAM-dependent methyltransferase, partial [Betaproteobacteria bacterium]